MTSVTLYSKPGCHLCESAQDELKRLERRYPHMLTVVDITTDGSLLQRYGERIPVVEIGGREYAAPLNPQVLERALRTARK
ncbi:MAG: glutaredoxin family protein [Chloroflexi bacterium]|nr:glutaredoxin family protein [Chloroflexota bacterium]